ncbi:hypothetical protein [Proteiniclasticum ruminis]|uniref:hypothetical protein n=1 Tax=Proteiniclasticum ruminis TaxID=398199 RepID=UPI0028ADF78A|nr:hypothetical protein [Proteiniclasticum ruminis]
MKRTEVTVRRPKKEEIFQIEEFMRVVLVDTYRKEQIDEKIYDLQEELASKRAYLASYFESGGEDRYFLVAVSGNNIVGTMEFGKQSALLKELTKGELRRRSIREFCLDSGYQSAQRIWKKKFGSPRYTFENYWAEGVSHEIWIVKI